MENVFLAIFKKIDVTSLKQKPEWNRDSNLNSSHFFPAALPLSRTDFERTRTGGEMSPVVDNDAHDDEQDVQACHELKNKVFEVECSA